jgi:hypothetical protein
LRVGFIERVGFRRFWCWVCGGGMPNKKGIMHHSSLLRLINHPFLKALSETYEVADGLKKFIGKGITRQEENQSTESILKGQKNTTKFLHLDESEYKRHRSGLSTRGVSVNNQSFTIEPTKINSRI